MTDNTATTVSSTITLKEGYWFPAVVDFFDDNDEIQGMIPLDLEFVEIEIPLDLEILKALGLEGPVPHDDSDDPVRIVGWIEGAVPLVLMAGSRNLAIRKDYNRYDAVVTTESANVLIRARVGLEREKEIEARKRAEWKMKLQEIEANLRRFHGGKKHVAVFTAALRAALRAYDTDARAIIALALESISHERVHSVERLDGALRPGLEGLEKALKALQAM